MGIYANRIKASDESRNTTTTVADDSDLTVPLVADGTVYKVNLHLWFQSSSVTPGFKFAIAYSSTLDTECGGLLMTTAQLAEVAAVGSLFYAFDSNMTSAQTRSLATSATATDIGRIHHVFTITPTADGTLSFQWSQNASSGTNVTVKAGSFMLVEDET